MKFRRLGEDRDQTLGFYFELSDQGASYGLGIYHRNLPMMEGLRQAIPGPAGTGAGGPGPPGGAVCPPRRRD